jgi:hypothetical protein
MIRLFFVPALGSALFLLAGCGADSATQGAGSTANGGGSGTSTGAAGIGGTSSAAWMGGAGGGSASDAALQAYCDATADAFCEAYFACCPDPQRLEQIGGGTVEKCKAAYRYHPAGSSCLAPGGHIKPYEIALEAGNTVFDQAGLDACVARLKAMSLGGAACAESPRLFYINVCTNTAFRGQRAPGEPCLPMGGNLATTTQCKHGRCASKINTCIPLAQLGEPCDYIASDGLPDLCEWGEENYCSPQPFPNGPSICVHRGDIGEPCGMLGLCKSNYCDGMTCTPPSVSELCY